MASSALPPVIAAAGGALFVAGTAHLLPDTVASHFDAAGAADGWMPRTGYLVFMLGAIALLPLLLAFVPRLALATAGNRINLPNRDYWLAPERRAATLEYMHTHSARFGVLLAAFLAYVHLLVVLANKAAVPRLPSVPFVVGLGVFMLCVVLWARGFARRFGRLPRA